jgi:hypothetical protein
LDSVQISVDFDLTAFLLAVTHDDDAVLCPQFRQVAAAKSGDGDVE